MEKHKILMIGPMPPPEGGMATSLTNILSSDLKGEYEISVLDITGCRTRRSGSVFRGIIYQFRLISMLLRIILVERPAIVHVHMASFMYFYRRSVDILICKLFGKKVVFHLHGGKFVDFYEKGSLSAKIFKRVVLGVSDRVIALSAKWHGFLSTLTSPEKIVVVPNGVICSDLSRVERAEKQAQERNSRISVLFAGAIGKRKGVFEILAAAARVIENFREITFLFAGPEEFGGEMSRFREMVDSLGLAGHVKYLGVVTGRDKTDLYLSADIFILPSYAENLPNSVLEAMAAGLPLVVSDVGALPEVVESGVNGFIVRAGDVNAIAERTLRLAGDRELRRSMGRYNLALAEKEYDMSVVAAKISDIYSGLLNISKKR